LRGRIHLIHGNHDRPAVTKSPLWASSQAFALVKVEGVQIALLHYGMRVWPGSGRGTLHLYGHSHGNLPGNRQCVDVGVDYPDWGMRPVGLPEIQAHLATLPERGRCQD
jgi:calcineurin-like phosphoesterase family protein